MPAVPPLPHGPHVSQPIENYRAVSGSTLASQRTEPHRPVTSDSSYLDGENICDITPPHSPQAHPVSASRRPSDSRTISGMSAISETQVAPPVLALSHSQHGTPSLPGIQLAVGPPQTNRPPTLDLQIPSPGLGTMPIVASSADSPQVRRLSNANTWPTVPNPHAAATTVPAGYPYSAPPTNIRADEFNTRRYPPQANSAQLANLQVRQPDEAPRRFSGGFHVPRVPVGSRTGEEFVNRRSQQRPLSQQQQQQQHPEHSAPAQVQPSPAPVSPRQLDILVDNCPARAATAASD